MSKISNGSHSQIVVGQSNTISECLRVAQRILSIDEIGSVNTNSPESYITSGVNVEDITTAEGVRKFAESMGLNLTVHDNLITMMCVTVLNSKDIVGAWSLAKMIHEEVSKVIVRVDEPQEALYFLYERGILTNYGLFATKDHELIGKMIEGCKRLGSGVSALTALFEKGDGSPFENFLIELHEADNGNRPLTDEDYAEFTNQIDNIVSQLADCRSGPMDEMSRPDTLKESQDAEVCVLVGRIPDDGSDKIEFKEVFSGSVKDIDGLNIDFTTEPEIGEERPQEVMRNPFMNGPFSRKEYERYLHSLN